MTGGADGWRAGILRRGFPALLAGAALALPSCSGMGFDALWGTDNGEGLLLVDAEVGWPVKRRIVCLVEEESRSSCSPDDAAVVIGGYSYPAQVFTQWRKNDPATVEIFLFGGRIVRCASPVLGVRVILRQLPLSQLPSQDRWDDATTRMFDGVPDRCAAAARRSG